MLSNALPEDEAPYKRTHYNHPSSKWVRESWRNWWWLAQLTECLLNEWCHRYEHDSKFKHACASKLLSMTVYANIHHPDCCTPTTPPPQCMPDDCKCDDTVQAYQNYYMAHKRHFATWKNGQPDWFV